MTANDSRLSEILRNASLLLRYPPWMRWLVATTIAASIIFVFMPIYALVIRIADDRKEKEWLPILFLVIGFGASAIYLIRHFKGISQPVKVSDQMLAHGASMMKWSELTYVWDSAFFSMLRIKDRKGQVLTFFQGLQGYSTLAAIAKEKRTANQAPLRTPGSVTPAADAPVAPPPGAAGL